MACAIGAIKFVCEGEGYRLTPSGANRGLIPPSKGFCLRNPELCEGE
jgi:hypothetical protein